MKVTSKACRVLTCSSSGAIKIGVRRQYFVYASDHDLHRMIAFLEDTPTQGNKRIYVLVLLQF